jgi:hypothetical protein
MVVAEKGLFFLKIKQIKTDKDEIKFEFDLNLEEIYFNEKTVNGAFEYAPGLIIALLKRSKKIRFIDRKNVDEVTFSKIPNPSNDNDYKSLRPFPNYDYETFPYVLIKDSKSLTVVNVSTMQSRVIIKNSPYKWDVHRTYMMDF